MSVDVSDENTTVKFEPWDENEGGIRRTPAEESEINKLEQDFKSPPASLYNRTQNQPKSKDKTGGATSFFVNRKLKTKSSLITIILLLFGGGGFLTVFFTPSMALNQLTQMMTQSLNDQFHAVNERSDMLLRAKLSDVTKGSCGLVKIACRFASMSDTQAERFKKAGIEIDRKPSALLKNRGQITEMRFTGTDGKEVKINSAEQLHRMSLDNIEFRAASTKAYNPMFSTLTDKVTTNVLKKLKARKMPITGETDEERQKKMNDTVSRTNTTSGQPLVETEDKDKGTTNYSVDGEPVTADQANGAKDIANKLKSITASGGYQSFAKGTLRGLSALGYAQTACSVYTFANVASSLGQVEKSAQAARFAIEGPLSTSDSIKAGEAKEGDVSFQANLATATHPTGTVVDESKLNQSTDSNNPPTTTDPDTGKTAFDSKGYKYVAYQEVPENLNFRESQFMLGGGTPTTLQKVLNSIATVVSPTNPTPKGVRENCHIINNPIVTIGSLGLGIVLGAGSFGLVTALGIGGSVAVSMAEPYFLSQAASTLSGDVFKNLKDVNYGDGTYVGSATFLSSVARARGAKPLNKEEGVKYLQKNLASTVTYNETQQYIARSDPFDVTNRFSFLGSLIFSAIPLIEKSKTSASSAMMNMASIIPTALSSLSPSAKAATVPANYFSCNDPAILGAGINADFYCVVHYGATEHELSIKPVDNALWMANTGNIDYESETGEPKDNNQPWNYIKFLSECVNRTTGWGIANENDEEDGSNCTDPAKESVNEQFRTYTMNKTINDAMDAKPQAMTTNDTEAYTDGQTGKITDGWSFPTKDDAVISQNFGAGSGREKNGVTITAKNPADTEGMPIFAVYDGTIVATGAEQGLDNRIIVSHWVNGKTVSTVYGHLGKNFLASGLKIGDTVKAGQQIGTITSVDDNTDARLYFEMWEGPTTTGQPVDPMGTLGVTRKTKEVKNV
ncbi:MAG: M23 family metallopeptidase [Candidatus Saccharimonadales bacterium]